MIPRTLFGRAALVIAVVSIAFQLFVIAVIGGFALLPLGGQATDDFAALMVGVARDWRSAAPATRPALQQRIGELHRLQVQDPPAATDSFTRALPYFWLLEAALSRRSGEAVRLRASRAGDGARWYWADLPAEGGRVQVGFPASRVAVQPSLALLTILLIGALVTLLTSTRLARWLIAPLSQLTAALPRIGRGQRPEPLREDGPTELAALAREFNRLGEQVEELLANRTTLLAGVSHDLRTPLARLQLALGMLSEKPAPDLVERALRDVEAMNALIARCLELGRDFAESESREVDLCGMLVEIAGEFAHAGVPIHGHRGERCRIRVRPLALRRILWNLVDNAVRYGGGRPVDIEHGIGGGRIEVRVLDRGPGIAEEEREAVFRPFYRGEPSRSSRTGGSGLGLAIARQLAEANGWTVSLRAREGGGTIAAVGLPLHEATA
ncbi:MAG: HAMP domain-containing protein [Burkholderiales bacterium]|nr:HAMP domain-containing protein [Burkholderiales bacterium]